VRTCELELIVIIIVSLYFGKGSIYIGLCTLQHDHSGGPVHIYLVLATR
jgi:hypothetical protein